jgi:hypothetical protein
MFLAVPTSASARASLKGNLFAVFCGETDRSVTRGHFMEKRANSGDNNHSAGNFGQEELTLLASTFAMQVAQALVTSLLFGFGGANMGYKAWLKYRKNRLKKRFDAETGQRPTSLSRAESSSSSSSSDHAISQVVNNTITIQADLRDIRRQLEKLTPPSSLDESDERKPARRLHGQSIDDVSG